MNHPGETRRLAAVLGCCVLSAIVVARTAWVVDNAYITFRTIDNLFHGYGLRWNVAERVQGFTHPLWLGIVAACYAVTRETYFTVLGLSLLLTVATMYLVVGRIATETAAATGAAAVLLFSKAFVDYTSSGLETPLTYALLALFCAAYFGSVFRRARTQWLALITGLLVLTDAWAAVLVLPALAVAMWRDRSRGLSRIALIAVAPVVVWELFAFVYYGAWLPNPTSARLNAHVPAWQLARHGLLYLFDSINLDPITLSVVVAACALAFLGGVREARPIAVGIVAYVALVVRAGGDAMSGRLLAAPLLCAAIVIARLDMAPLTVPVRLQLFAAVVGLELISPRPLMYVRRYADSPALYVSEISGIVDQRPLSYLNTGLLNARRDVPWPLEENAPGGRTARESQLRVVVSASSGMEGFFGGPAVHIINSAGVTDPVLARLPAAPPWTIGPQTRRIPAGYEAIVAGRQAGFDDPVVSRLYSQIVTATRDPIWSWHRFRRILQLNFGRQTASGAS
jgi:arabinofuranosyltransferase